MIQLSFQPAFDPLHGMFRLLRMIPILNEVPPLEKEHVRILDFYLIYPFRLANARLKHEDRRVRSIAKELEWLAPYGSQPDSAGLLERMRPFQETAMGGAVTGGFLDAERYERGFVLPTKKPVPAAIAKRIEQANEREYGVTELVTALTKYELRGYEGLKARTSLMEYRYDPR